MFIWWACLFDSHYWDTCGSPVIKCLCFSVVFFFSSATKWKNCAIVPSGHWALNTMTTNCDPMRVKVFTYWSRVILMMTDVAMHGEGRVTWRTTRFLLKTLLSVILYDGSGGSQSSFFFHSLVLFLQSSFISSQSSFFFTVKFYLSTVQFYFFHSPVLILI